MECELPLCPVITRHQRRIEQAEPTTLQVCFATSRLGGAVLDDGSTMVSNLLLPSWATRFARLVNRLSWNPTSKRWRNLRYRSTCKNNVKSVEFWSIVFCFFSGIHTICYVSRTADPPAGCRGSGRQWSSNGRKCLKSRTNYSSQARRFFHTCLATSSGE